MIVPPAIDPLSPKNMALSADDARFITNQFGVDAERPFILQVSRFDPWKDPLGVIGVYRLVKEEIPEIQLVLLGSTAPDDPEGLDYWYKTVNYAAGVRSSLPQYHRVSGGHLFPIAGDYPLPLVSRVSCL